MAHDENRRIAQTILDQMGGPQRLRVMLGARGFVAHERGVSFQWPNRQRSRGNALRITLRGDDTYRLEFLNTTARTCKVVRTVEGLYCDELIDVFERQTGLAVRL